MRKILQALFIVGLMLNITTLFAQEKIYNENKIYQVTDYSKDKTSEIKVKEFFVRLIRNSEYVKPIENHDFVHFFLEKYDNTIRPALIERFKGVVTLKHSELISIIDKELMPPLVEAFNQYQSKHTRESKPVKINQRHFELYDLGNRETNKGPGQPCNNADFETGNTNGWDLSYGMVDAGATAPYSYINVNATTLAASPGQHTIMTGAGTDAIGGFPVVFPGGTSSLMIGDGTGTNNSAADASQTFMVDAGSAAFSYSYAIVLMDPGHTEAEQPYFKVNMYDASGNSIQCGDYAVVAGGTALDPDFIPFTYGGENGVYMPWRTTFAPLQGYIGTNVTIEFVVGDCTQGGHFGYAYLDASCAPMDVLGPDTITCAGFPTISAPPGAASYLWTPTGETTQSIVATAPGHYTVAVTPVTGAACAITLDKDIYEFIDTVTAVFNAVPTNICTGESITFTDQSIIVGIGAIDGWEWDFDGNGTVDNTTQNPSYVYNTPGTYNVNLNASSGVCEDDTIRQVIVIAGTTADFIAPTVCIGMTTDFTDASLGTVDTWAWDFNNDGIVDNTTQNPSYTFPVAGTYPVNLEVSIGGSCADDTTINVIVSQSSTANFTAPTVCVGVATAFTDVSIGGVDTWGWDFDNDGIVDNTTQNPSYTFPSSGTFPVNLEVSVGGFCLHDTTINITISTSSTAIFTSTTVCNGVATDFTDSSIGGVDTWGWDFNNDGIVDNTTQNPSYTFPSSGTFPVNLEVSVGGSCSHDTTINVTVSQGSTAIFTSTTGCIGVATDFTDASIGGVDTWAWDFDNDGIVDNTTQNPSYTFPSSGTFPVNLEVSVGGVCSHDTTINIVVSPQPTAAFTFTNVCFGTTTGFTDLSNPNGGTINQWAWDFTNNGSVDNATQNPTNGYAAAGSYTVELHVTTTDGCKDSVTRVVVVNPIPVADFTATTECLGNITTFTNNSTVITGNITTWAWDFGDASNDTTQSPIHNYSSAGAYNVVLTATSDSGCINNFNTNVIVHPKPTANFNVNNVCLNIAAPITDASVGNGDTINQWQWDFTNDGVIDNTNQNPSNFYVAEGTFDIRLVITTSNGCKDTIIKPITIYPMPLADFTYINDCVDAGINFTNTSTVTSGTIDNWAWQFGDTQTSALENPTNNYASEGVYNVQLIVTTNNNCSDTIVKNGIEVWPLPVVNFIPTSVCLNANTQFTDLSTVSNLFTANNNVAWDWNFADGIGTSIVQHPIYMYTTDGIFNATLTVTTDHNCVNDTTLPVTVHPLPVVDFTPDFIEGCTPVCVTFTDNTQIQIADGSTITQWDWDFNADGITDNITQNPPNCFVNPSHSSVRDFDIRLIATSNFGCKDTLVKTDYIHSYPIPLASFMYWPNDEASIVDNDITFTDQSIIAATWAWDLGDGTLTNVQHPVHEYTDTGFYMVELKIENIYGCKDSTEKYINIKPIYAIYIPNSFTPNGDNINDYFYVNGYGIKELKMMIFDRWGMKLYDDIGVEQSWDGVYKGNLVPTDVYVYKVRAKDVFGEWHDYIGRVTIIK